LPLLRCFRPGNVKCLSELINDFDLVGLSFPLRPPSRGVKGVVGANGPMLACRPADRGSVAE
jgi:hypothetical protein